MEIAKIDTIKCSTFGNLIKKRLILNPVTI